VFSGVSRPIRKLVFPDWADPLTPTSVVHSLVPIRFRHARVSKGCVTPLPLCLHSPPLCFRSLPLCFCFPLPLSAVCVCIRHERTWCPLFPHTPHSSTHSYRLDIAIYPAISLTMDAAKVTTLPSAPSLLSMVVVAGTDGRNQSMKHVKVGRHWACRAEL
jgi:hypothetical protein